MQFASQTLAVAEQKYFPIEGKALSILFMLRKFAHIMLGEHIILQTYHRSLVFLDAGRKHNHKLTQ